LRDFVEFVNKPKWRICFVRWRESEIGIALWVEGFSGDFSEENGPASIAALTREEVTEFREDVTKAVFERFNIKFQGDVEPKVSRKEFAQKLLDHLAGALEHLKDLVGRARAYRLREGDLQWLN